jgi:hypothetical protein
MIESDILKEYHRRRKAADERHAQTSFTSRQLFDYETAEAMKQLGNEIERLFGVILPTYRGEPTFIVYLPPHRLRPHGELYISEEGLYITPSRGKPIRLEPSEVGYGSMNETGLERMAETLHSLKKQAVPILS